jgi:hypothetical protein
MESLPITNQSEYPIPLIGEEQRCSRGARSLPSRRSSRATGAEKERKTSQKSETKKEGPATKRRGARAWSRVWVGKSFFPWGIKEVEFLGEAPGNGGFRLRRRTGQGEREGDRGKGTCTVSPASRRPLAAADFQNKRRRCPCACAAEG